MSHRDPCSTPRTPTATAQQSPHESQIGQRERKGGLLDQKREVKTGNERPEAGKLSGESWHAHDLTPANRSASSTVSNF